MRAGSTAVTRSQTNVPGRGDPAGRESKDGQKHYWASVGLHGYHYSGPRRWVRPGRITGYRFMAVPDGSGARPDPQVRSGLPIQGPDRPEAFGRGEHPEAKSDGQQRAGGKAGGSQGGQGQEKGGGDKQGAEKGDDKKGDDKEQKPFWKRPVLMTVLVAVLLAAAVGGGVPGVVVVPLRVHGRRVHRRPDRAGGAAGGGQGAAKLLVDDNQHVEADSTLIEIDPQPFQVRRDQQVAAEKQAEAQQAQAEAQLLVSRGDGRPGRRRRDRGPGEREQRPAELRAVPTRLGAGPQQAAAGPGDGRPEGDGGDGRRPRRSGPTPCTPR